MIQSEREQNNENNKLLDSVKGLNFFFFNNNKDWNDRARKMKIRFFLERRD